jgi:hypothetical protein
MLTLGGIDQPAIDDNGRDPRNVSNVKQRIAIDQNEISNLPDIDGTE